MRGRISRRSRSRPRPRASRFSTSRPVFPAVAVPAVAVPEGVEEGFLGALQLARFGPHLDHLLRAYEEQLAHAVETALELVHAGHGFLMLAVHFIHPRHGFFMCRGSPNGRRME